MNLLSALCATVLLLSTQDEPSSTNTIPPTNNPVNLTGTTRSTNHIPHSTIPINVPVSSGASMVTCVTFPEESLRSIVAAWDEDAISLEHTDGKLFIKLIGEKEGHVDVFGGSGRHYRLYIRATRTGVYDESVTVRVRNPAPRTKRKKAPMRAPALELILSMRRGERPEGAVISSGPSNQIYTHEGARMHLLYIYSMDGLVGYVIRVTNKTKAPYGIDLSQYQGKDLLLIGAKEMIVPVEGTTLLYLVFDGQK